MAKRLLLNVLVSVLGDYIDGLTEENLKLGVWSGEIVLNNLQVNRSILQRLNLPIVIIHGSVKNLQVRIPWASLESNPVRITIDGIYLQVGPLDLSVLDAEELTNRALEVKQYKLTEADKAMEASLKANKPTENLVQNATYWQRLTSTIIDNIEITLTNFHLRYEDSRTLPKQPFSTGITLDSFTLKATNKEWQESFVARSAAPTTKGIPAAFKLAKIRNLGVYWNSHSEVFGNLKFTPWEVAMQEFIYTAGTLITTNI